MLKKIYRLTKDKDFNRVFKEGHSSFNKMVGIKAVENGKGYSRFGILVGVKVSKKAILRNKIKRQIREIIKLDIKNIKSGFDYVIICLPAIVGKSYEEIEESFRNNIKRLKID
jgi:ribonuclease P protein component